MKKTSTLVPKKKGRSGQFVESALPKAKPPAQHCAAADLTEVNLSPSAEHEAVDAEKRRKAFYLEHVYRLTSRLPTATGIKRSGGYDL